MEKPVSPWNLPFAFSVLALSYLLFMLNNQHLLSSKPVACEKRMKKLETGTELPKLQGPLNGGVSNGRVSRSGLVLPFLSFFVLFGTFPIFLGFSRFARGMVRGFSRLVLFLFLGLLRAPTRNSPERVRDTIWTFPEKSGKHPGLETPQLGFSQKLALNRASRRAVL